MNHTPKNFSPPRYQMSAYPHCILLFNTLVARPSPNLSLPTPVSYAFFFTDMKKVIYICRVHSSTYNQQDWNFVWTFRFFVDIYNIEMAARSFILPLRRFKKLLNGTVNICILCCRIYSGNTVSCLCITNILHNQFTNCYITYKLYMKNLLIQY